MAYVSISKDLTDSIRSTIHGLRDAELNSMASLEKFDEAVRTNTDFHTTIVNNLWAEELDLRERLTKHNRTLDVHLEIKAFYDTAAGTRSINRTIVLSKLAVPCFVKFKQSWGDAYLQLHVDAADYEVLAPLRDILVARDECIQRWAAVEKQVLAFIEKCKSLNEAVKLWPDLRRYVNREYTGRLDKKVERTRPEQSEAAAALKALDVDLVNSSVVLARMAGAKV